MAIYKGIGCHWGVGSSTYSLTNGKLQTRDHDRKTDTEMVKDDSGITISKIFYDPNEDATFECITTGSAGTGNVSPILPACGDVVTITDAVYTQVSGSATGVNVWLVDDVSTKSSNTAAMRVTIKLLRYSNLTVA